MLQFILGKSGCGKTAFLQNRIAELIEAGQNNIIMLVPDQSTFETEKSFLNLFGAKNARKVKVFGFSRLCRYVFEKIGKIPQNVIDNGTRAVLMNITLEQLTEKLKLFRGRNMRAVSEVMLQTLTECKKNSVTPDKLRKGAEKISEGTLKDKLLETALILDTYDAIVSQSYIDPLDDLDRLAEILTENALFKDYVFCIDAFSGFTAQQLKVLQHIIKRCADCYITLTMNPNAINEEVFETSYKTMRTISKLAKCEGVEIKAPIKLEKNYRTKSDELILLENGAYRSDYDVKKGVPKDIKLCAAADFYSECEYVAQQIKMLILEKGYFYSDISVITHDTEPYSGILNVVFDKYEIPYFMDVKKDIEVKPVIRLVLALFRIVLNNFEREDVVSALKTGLLPFSSDDISAFENYTYVWNVSGSALKNEFKNNPNGFSDNLSETDEIKLRAAENIRFKLVSSLTNFKENCKDKNATQITEIFYKLLIDLKIPDNLNNIYEKLEIGEKGLGAEQIRIWNTLMEILDKIVAVCGEMSISLERYFELLSILIVDIKLSEIPQTIDSVMVTTAQRVRLSNRKISFLIGCNDGSFPAVPHASGVFSAYELKILSNNDISISEDFSDLASLETFMAYSCLTSACEKLFVSHPVSDLLGNQYTPSSIINEICKIFPEIILETVPDERYEEKAMLALQPAFDAYAADYKKSAPRLFALRDIFAGDTRYSAKLNALERAAENAPFKIEKTENTHALFGDNLRISASQIEKFNLCRFSYFCNYGLRVRERRRAKIDHMEYGTLVHYVLERFFSKFTKTEYSVLSEEHIEAFVDSAIEVYTDNYFGDSKTHSGAFMYKLKNVKNNLCLLLKHMISELCNGNFEVADCELNIGKDIPAYTIKLPTGENIAVYGSIDRVDLMEDNGVKYLRIVDYKTGSKDFNLSDILFGLNLQMLLYLYSAKLNGEQRYGDVNPAGILYMPATVPIITAEKGLSDDKINAELDKKLKMNGLLLDDVNVIKGMDSSENGKYIPVKIKLNTPQSERSLATVEQFGKIFSKIDRLVAEMGRELYKGNIQASPAKGAHDACEYCPYDSVCVYHMSTPKNTFSVTNDEVYKKIDSENGGEQ